VRPSAHYELQSMVDIGRAQAMARTDQSGHALGTAMYLAQQSVEKQLKSIVLRLDEELDLGSVEKVLRGLSHEFYPSLYKWYYRHLESEQLSTIRRYEGMINVENSRHEVESFASHFREASTYWEEYRKNRRIQVLTWMQSLDVGLPDEDFNEMNSWHKSQLEFVRDGMPGHGEHDLGPTDSISVPDQIRLEVMDDEALARRRVTYADTPANSKARAGLADTFEEGNVCFLPYFKTEFAGMCPIKVAKSVLFEFGFRILASMTQHYVLLYPHNTIGRYPEPIGDGLFSTDVYERHASFVMGYLFVIVPYHLRELRTNSERIDDLSRRGRRLGYW